MLFFFKFYDQIFFFSTITKFFSFYKFLCDLSVSAVSFMYFSFAGGTSGPSGNQSETAETDQAQPTDMPPDDSAGNLGNIPPEESTSTQPSEHEEL